MKKCAVLTIHGIGNVGTHYASGFLGALQGLVGEQSSQIHWSSIRYKTVQQENEQHLWQKYEQSLAWKELRKSLLFNVSDAAGFEYDKLSANSNYMISQRAIAAELWKASQATEPGSSILIVADSLGGHVLSCYLWDAQNYNPRNGRGFAGIWLNADREIPQIINQDLSPSNYPILAGTNIAMIISTGCNIPIFLASLPTSAISPIAKPSPEFQWQNLYDKDDVLGWPLAPLCPAYAELVNDIDINVSGPDLKSKLLMSWNPSVHTLYWQDIGVKRFIADEIRQLLATKEKDS